MLNTQQKQAVEHTGSPLCIFAGPGTGKTLTLQKKITHLINTGTKNENILALTFTKSAATELLGRVTQEIRTNSHLNINTFHAKCLKVVLANPIECGLDQGFKLISPEQQQQYIYEILKEMGFNWNQTYIPIIREALSKAKKEQQWEEQPTYAQEIARSIYRIYNHKLIENNQIDLDDVIIKVNFMFENHPNILKEYQELWKHILVDEAQDMDARQYDFIKQLNQPNTTIVGDDDQSIYEFTGANLKYMNKFIEEFKATKIILDQNYRNTQNILNASQEVIRNNSNRQEKDITTKNKIGEKIKILISNDEFLEAYNIAKLSKDTKNTAILYRQNKQSIELEQAMQSLSVPYQIVGGTGLYERKEIKDAIAIIILTYKNNATAFARVLATQYSIGEKTIEKLINHASITKQPLLSSLKANVKGIREEQHNTLSYIYSLYQDAKEQDGKQYAHLISQLLTNLNEQQKQRIKQFLSNLYNWKGTIQEFIKQAQNTNSTPQTVKLLTFHKSKGMEFDNVIISGCEQGLLPYKATSYEITQPNIEEERRLLYVALTRASKNILISYVKKRQLFEKQQKQLPSQFLEEIPKDLMEYK